MELDRQLLAQSMSLGLLDSSEETQSAFSAMDEYLTDSENQLISTRRQNGEELNRKINQYDFSHIILYVSAVIYRYSSFAVFYFDSHLSVCVLAKSQIPLR